MSGVSKENINVLNHPQFETLFEEGFGVFPQNAVFIAAVSGGADSTAMLIALASLAKKRNYKIHCLHIRHNIRSAEESERDAAFVRSLCTRLQIPLRIVSIKPGKITQRSREKGIGIEAAAREYRQAAFRHEAIRLGAEKVVVAHNQDDVLENSIMRILRGSGPRGLASMPSSTKLILRPMIHISRKQILNFLEKNHQSYQFDKSNDDNHYVRNRVRNVLIPVLNEHFPEWKKGMESLGETQSIIADYVETEARKLVEWQLCAQDSLLCVNGVSKGVETAAENLERLNPVLQEEAVFQGIEKLLQLSSGKVDALHADSSRKYKVPRRSVLRKFLHRGGASLRGCDNSLDLGKIRLERSGGKLQILFWEDPLLHRGASFCAEKTGDYQFMHYSIKIDEKIDTEVHFSCELPLVFRTPMIGEKIPSEKSSNKKTKNAKNSIIVEDRNGKIALLSHDGNISLFKDRTSIGNIAVSVKLS
jgi:tRNA(Ile)-lysidine synthase